MALNVGDRLGHYDVTALLGEGGMGQVWQATDTQLNRQVALKILPDAFAADPDRFARFKREAQILASLNHPNIAAIYGIEESEGTRALVLELVEGPTLADRISKGPIPLDEALPIAKQIAEALEAAHEAGVIHRDLKPANIKVRDDGTVKVLDFGLAKAFDPSPDADPSQSPTLTAAATQMGVILGTAAYMSPEQARGSTVDRRADIWSFAVVLYEMLTGRKPFPGDDISQTLARVIDRDPDWDVLPKTLSPALDTYLRRCLQKDPRQRVRDIGDVRLALEGAFETPGSMPSEPTVALHLHPWQRPVPALLAVLLVAVVAGLGSWVLTRSAPAPRPDVMRFTIIPADTAPLNLPGGAHDLAISRDGTQIVYQSNGGQFNLRPIDQLSGAPLRGAQPANGPFLSPDGLWVGFATGGTTLQRVSILGGAPVTLAELPSPVAGASWGLDDQIIIGTADGGLLRIPGGGGEPEVLTTADADLSESHRGPFIIPRREAVLFAIGSPPFVTGAELAVLELESGAVTRLGLAGVSPHYVSTGHVVYAAEDGSLRAVPFDAGTLSVTGSPVPLVASIPVKSTGAADFDISDNGRLVYVPTLTAAGQTSRLVVVGRDGAGTTLADIEGLAYYPRFSPDGTRVAYAVAQAPGANTDADLWVLDVERGTRTRLTSGGSNRRFYPVWSPDGARLAYSESANNPNRVMVIAADGGGEPEILLDDDDRRFPMSWARDGSALALYRGGIGDSRDLEVLPLDSDSAPVPFLGTPAQERGVSFSPNAQWLAYVSNETGQDEIYVRPYPGSGGQISLSRGGGQEAVWGPDGSELFYRNGDQLMVVDVETGQTFSASAPAPFLAAPYTLDNAAGGGGNPNYDISPDGQQFVFVEHDSGPQNNPEINVVLNWHQELLERVPVP